MESETWVLASVLPSISTEVYAGVNCRLSNFNITSCLYTKQSDLSEKLTGMLVACLLISSFYLNEA